ncbi:hypothetical protein CDAR_29371 [Caerostris darwini]|uniref:Uncharacterized protein n=1 Tax=Caerostris darwini TaxID=1538125 RepID=A0AAV4RZ69_9ARAC|nr:hypothetical protein CDAR_29371 [Caerostris darwini]
MIDACLLTLSKNSRRFFRVAFPAEISLLAQRQMVMLFLHLPHHSSNMRRCMLLHLEFGLEMWHLFKTFIALGGLLSLASLRYAVRGLDLDI